MNKPEILGLKMKNKYPECEKLHEAKKHGGKEISEFLEWLSEEGYSICKFYPEEYSSEGYCPERKSIEQWIAERFNIDLDKVDAERMQIIKELQNEND